MIRILVILLLCLNIILLLSLGVRASNSGKNLSASSPVQQEPYLQEEGLTLLSELDGQRLRLKKYDVEEVALKKDGYDQSIISQEQKLDSSLQITSLAVDQCFVISNLYDKPQAEALAKTLKESDFTVSTFVDLTEVPGSFVVYIEPYATEAQARRQLLNLRALNIDSFVITEGPRVNGISLGVFATNENAVEHKAILDSRGYGYNINTAQFNIEKEGYRLLLKRTSSIIFDKKDMDSMLDRSSDASIEQKPCNEVAS